MPRKASPVVVLRVQPDNERGPGRLLTAFFLSFVLNGFIIGVFFVSDAFRATATVTPPDEPMFIPIDEPSDKPDPMFEPEIGDPDLGPKGVKNERDGEQNIPAPVLADAPPGITGDPGDTLPSLPTFGVNKEGPNGTAPAGDGTRPGLNPIPRSGFQQRLSGESRLKLANENGGSLKTEAAVAMGLEFLAKHQDSNGRWSFAQFHEHGRCNCTGQSKHDDIAATAFGLMPFLGAGNTHKNSSKYTKQIDSGLRFLLLRQNRDGEFHPLMYSHGLATMAVCEAYGLTNDAALRNSAQRAVDYIVAAQSKEGGWRYGKGQAGYDTSVGGWQLMALKSGQMANLRVPTESMIRARKWLDEAGTPDGSAYGYTTRGEGVNTTAVGLLCREYLGWGPRHPGIQAGIRRLQTWKPQPQNMYFSYYATQVMHHAGGPAWDSWNPVMRDSLLATQDKGDDAVHPHQKGSWNHAGSYAGRLMDTSLSILTLEVYYRHLPLYRRDVGSDKLLLEP